MVTKITILLKSKTKIMCYAMQTILRDYCIIRHLLGYFLYSALLICGFVMVSIMNSDFNKNRLEQD